MALITWEQAKAELGLIGDEQQEQIMLKAEQATAMVLHRISGFIEREQPEWTAATDPAADPIFAQVQAAILAQTGELYRFRGDDPQDWREDPIFRYDLAPRVVRILAQIEDPTCA